MFDAALNVLLSLLREAGITATAEYPTEAIRRKDGALVCVGLKNGKSASAGFGGYLGLRSDPERGEMELYGFQTELLVGLTVYAPEDQGAQGCAACYEAAVSALTCLPTGLRLKSLSRGPAAPDLGTGMFKCEAELSCAAHFVCARPADGGEFQDFALYGHVVNSI